MERNWSTPNPSDPGGECNIYRPRPYGLYNWESILGMDTNEERSCAILAHLTNQSFVSNKRTRAKTWVLLVPSQGLVLSVRTYNLSSHRSLSDTGETMVDYWLPFRMLSWLVPIWIPPLHVTRRVRARLADVLYQTQTIGDSDQVPSSHNLSFALLCATVYFGTLSFARLSSSSVAFRAQLHACSA